MSKRECAVLGIVASVLFAIFYGVPLIQMLTGSLLSNAELGASGHFSGARNYVLAWRDPAYRQAFLASTAFTLAAVFLQMTLAFGAALLTRQSFRFVGILPMDPDNSLLLTFCSSSCCLEILFRPVCWTPPSNSGLGRIGRTGHAGGRNSASDNDNRRDL